MTFLLHLRHGAVFTFKSRKILKFCYGEVQKLCPLESVILFCVFRGNCRVFGLELKSQFYASGKLLIQFFFCHFAICFRVERISAVNRSTKRFQFGKNEKFIFFCTKTLLNYGSFYLEAFKLT